MLQKKLIGKTKLLTSPKPGKPIVQKEYRTFMFRVTPTSDPDYETIKELHERIEAYFRARSGLEKCVHRHMELRGTTDNGPLKHWLMLEFENIDDANMFKLYFVNDITTGGVRFE
jgi:IS4 transposase